MAEISEVGDLIEQARRIAVAYKRLTGRPLGITGEMAEYEAARLLGLKLAEARAPGYDALRGAERIQIKGRVLGPGAKSGQRLGSIKLDHPWETVLFVSLDEDLRPTGIWEASRAAVEAALSRTESKARQRGALSVDEFKKIGPQVWHA
jgi:hypothetical protein